MFSSSRCYARPRRAPSHARDRGQIAVLAAVVLGLMIAMGLAVALVGAALIERTNATIATDAVALADARDPAVAGPLIDWYARRGYDVGVTDGWASVLNDRVQAQSRAVTDQDLTVAPVVIAIVARAEQLLGRELIVVHHQDVSVTFAAQSARDFGAVATELGMCRAASDTFTRC